MPRRSGRPPAATPTVENFGELAAKYSIERSSRALEGQVPPIRRYGGQPILEEEAFALKPGDLSGVIQLDDKYVILFCEGYTKPIDVKFAEVKKDIVEDIRDKKERLAMSEYYERLQDIDHDRQLPRPGGQPFAQPRPMPTGSRPARRCRPPTRCPCNGDGLARNNLVGWTSRSVYILPGRTWKSILQFDLFLAKS